MSGIGKTFKRKVRQPDGTMGESKHLWISFPFHGKTRRESAHVETEAEARKVLKRRLEEIGRRSYKPNQDRVTLDDLVDLLKADYRNNALLSLNDALKKLKAPLAFFKGYRVSAITVQMVDVYVDERLAAGRAVATVNGELKYLRLLFNLGLEKRVIGQAPRISILAGENKRDGFIDPGDFENLLSKFTDPDVADLVEFLGDTGWRVNAGRCLEWPSVDLRDRTILMTGLLSKNKTPFVLPISRRLEEIIARRTEKRRLDCPFVFHRYGKPIVDFNRAWKSATAKAGVPRLLVHDLCRSAARNLAKAGVKETVATKYLHRKTLNIYKQYRIVDTEDLRDAGAELDRFLDSQQGNRKVENIGEAKSR